MRLTALTVACCSLFMLPDAASAQGTLRSRRTVPLFEEQQSLRTPIPGVRSLVAKDATPREEHDCASMLALQMVSRAHPSHSSAVLDGYVLKRVRQKVLLVMDVTYTGGWTGNPYRALLTLRINPNTSQIESLDFRDLNNSISPNAQNLNAWKRETNAALDGNR